MPLQMMTNDVMMTNIMTMNKKQSIQNRPKHVPQRTCIGCRQVGGKRSFIRIVRTADGVTVDPTGKAAGRGAYIHNNRMCWEKVLEGNRLNQALRTAISPQDRRVLATFATTIPHDKCTET